MKWLILVLGILSNASASVLIKVAFLPPRKSPSVMDLYTIIFNQYLILGVLLYGVAFVLYACALSRLPLNVAHPVLTAGSIATVACASMFIFNESFSISLIVGLILIVLGVLLICANI